MSEGKWVQVSDDVKKRIRTLIREKEFTDMLKTGDYVICAKTDKERVYQEVPSMSTTTPGNTDDLILIKKL